MSDMDVWGYTLTCTPSPQHPQVSGKEPLELLLRALSEHTLPPVHPKTMGWDGSSLHCARRSSTAFSSSLSTSARVAPTRLPGRPQRGPYTGRGARTARLVGDRTRALTPSPPTHDDESAAIRRRYVQKYSLRGPWPAAVRRTAGW